MIKVEEQGPEHSNAGFAPRSVLKSYGIETGGTAFKSLAVWALV